MQFEDEEQIAGHCGQEAALEDFQALDRDANGFITVDELERNYQDSGEELQGEAVDEEIRWADTDGDGQINFAEYEDVLNSDGWGES